MPPNASLDFIFDRLQRWAKFPKYALERRLDIFLTPFLEDYISSELGGTALLVAPEFPLLASLFRKPKREGTRPPPPGLTVNVDYLFYVKRDGHGAWVLLELKTDCNSYDPNQLARYVVARDGVRAGDKEPEKWGPNRAMARLLAELKFVERRTGSPGKYLELRNHVRRSSNPRSPIELVYLAPRSMKKFPEKLRKATRTKLLCLEDFADSHRPGIAPEHRELWGHVCGLVGKL